MARKLAARLDSVGIMCFYLMLYIYHLFFIYLGNVGNVHVL